MLILSEAGIDAQPRRGVSREQLKEALDILGLDFTEAERTVMLPGVNRNLVLYSALRGVSVPLDTEPAFHFRPALPGTEPKPRPPKFLPSHDSKISVFHSVDDLAFTPVTELAALLRARKLSSADLTRMYLSRLKRFSPKLLCVVTLTEELALRQAAQADREIRSGKYRGPLHGIPYGAKDLFNTRDIATTWGAEPFEHQVPSSNATAIERLQNAGAVLVAKLSMGALAQGDVWFAGMTRNPWNLEQGSSGSSAGPASATAAGLVGFSIGTETLGSIVSPSTRCGVTGLRPTYGRVSRYGAMGLSWTMDKIGPICRSVEDCALVLNAMHGPDGHDPTAIDAPFDWNPAAPLSGLKIGYLKREFDLMIEERKKLYDSALDAMTRAGARLEPVDLPSTQASAILILLQAEAAAAFDDITRDGRLAELKGQNPGDWPNSFRISRLIPAVEYIRAQRARTLLQQQMHEFMQTWDVIVSPSGSATLTITNLTGHPQVVVPCGFIGMAPQSLLFTGRIYEEGAPLRVAHAYQQATDWHNRHPQMDWA